MLKNCTLTLLAIFCTLFTFSQTTRIITDFHGYWSSTAGSPNPTLPDTSHMLLGFTFNGVTYSTGVNDGILITNGVTFTPANFRAFPVAGIAGTYGSGDGGGVSCYAALAKKVDGLPSAANIPAVADYSIRKALIDGIHGLDLGTGVTNLPTSAVMNFRIFSIDASKINDEEPDIILTQIAQPSSPLNDQFSLVDASGTQVGSAYVQDMTVLPSFGNYGLDLYNFTPNTSYNAATVFSIKAPDNINTTRPIRVVALKLSVFGITAANVGQVAALKIVPSGISDYAFIAYNVNAINLTPNISQNSPLTNTNVCSGGIAHLSVIATPALGGALTYSWEESTDAGSTWHPVTDGGSYSGATTDRLAVTNPGDGYRYRATVVEVGNAHSVTSDVFQVTIIPTPTAPTSVTIAGGATVCRGTPVQLTSTVTGGTPTNLYYQWQSDPDPPSSFQDIPDANLSTYVPPVNQIGGVSYKLTVSSGSGCLPSQISPTAQVITINGISSTTPAERCGAGPVTLNAAASSGTISWFNTDVGGTTVTTGPSYSPSLTGSTTYYVSTSICASASRVPIKATISPASAGGTLNGSATVPSGSNTATLTLAAYTGTIAKWQSSTDNFVSNIVDIASTSNQLTVTNLTQTTSYRVQVQNGSCPPEFSTTATINMEALAIHVGSVKATRENEGIRVEWTAYNQQNTLQFEIERSTDGANFTQVHTLPSNGSVVDTKYQWLDASPAQGRNYYRIKEVYRSGSHEYSAVVNAMFENGPPGIAVYPNPVINRNITLEFRNMKAGKYQLSYTSNSGQVVYKETILHSGGYRTYTKPVSLAIGPGIYRLVITAADGAIRTHSTVIVQ